MKFSTIAASLKNILKQVIPAVGRDVQALESVALSLEGSTLALACTNHEIRLGTACEVATELEGKILVNAGKLSKIITSIDDNATLTFTVDGDNAVIKSGKSRFKLQVLPYDDFPAETVTEDQVWINMDAEHLLDCIASTKHAMAKQDVRFYLNGMLMVCDDGSLTTVATDGHRLAMSTVPCGEGSSSKIIPRSSVSVIEKMLTSGNVALGFDAHSISAAIGGVTIRSQLIDGRFPDYRRVLPEAVSTTCTVNAGVLRTALSRVSTLGNDKYNGVRIWIKDGSITLQANNTSQEEATDQVDCAYSGDPIEIGVNSRYLIDTLATIKGDAVISVKDSNSSMRIETDDESTAIHVVMPMRL
jgi:DNA polymerase-3 subunit beta